MRLLIWPVLYGLVKGVEFENSSIDTNTTITATTVTAATTTTTTTTTVQPTTELKPSEKPELINKGFIKNHICHNIAYQNDTLWSKTQVEIVDFWNSGFVMKFNIHSSNFQEVNDKFAIRFKVKNCRGGSLKAWNAKMEIDVNKNIVFRAWGWGKIYAFF